MNKEEIVALEIERRALLETVSQFSKCDMRMDSELNELCLFLEKKAAIIYKMIYE